MLDWSSFLYTYVFAGGLVCRGIIQAFPNHNIHTFISLSAPLMGQYGG